MRGTPGQETRRGGRVIAMKTWTCTQCGNSVEKNLVASVSGGPAEFDNCGNDEFDDPITMGAIHTKLDGILP